MSQLLRKEKFADLDCIADTARSRKDMFPGGLWKLHAVYAGIEVPQLHATEEDWQEQLALLQHWVEVNPNSITARIALAHAYVGYGWEARGPGFADTVSTSGWRQFGERLQKAKDILDQASKLSAKCPEWYLAMQAVAQGQSWDIEEAHGCC